MNQYQITSLDDILKIPSHRMDDFFAEFSARVKELAEVKEIAYDLAKSMGTRPHENMVTLSGMAWVDDGKRDIETTITIRQEHQARS